MCHRSSTAENVVESMEFLRSTHELREEWNYINIVGLLTSPDGD
jgi:hypothetical protein